MNYQFLQEYWWLLISVLGALLVFMLFVQGGQSMIPQMKEGQREDMIFSIAHRWELTFTVLVTFGGAFFASFPLFYSTSFGGAYWIWMIILFGFVVQAVSFKYRTAEGNILGRRGYDIFLFINGILAPLLLGGAVATFFFGSDFTVDKGSIVDASAPVISRWGDWHGLEVLMDWRVVMFGLMVLFLTRVQANLWFLNQVKDVQTAEWNRKQLLVNAPVFVVLFLATVAVLLTASGYETTDLHEFRLADHKYLDNFIAMPAALLCFLAGTLLVLYAVFAALFRKSRSGIWFSGFGTVLVVLSLFWVAGYNGTPYYPSYADVESSLTIYNSSSSEFTLEVMSIVSLAIPFVLAYIAWVWHKLTK